MSWTNVDDKHKKRFDRHFVSCEESYERNYVIRTIMEGFPHFSKEKIEAAVAHCCKTIPAPRERKNFLRCISEYLER